MPSIYRKWVAISAIAATLEEKVWIMTSAPLYANLYMMLIGPPGIGKSRAIDVGRDLYCNLPESHMAPISMKWASLVDSLHKAKRNVIKPGQPPIEYNAMYICADEIGAFIHKFDSEITDGLSALYDPRSYSQHRRTFNIRIELATPQVNMLCGSTPQNLTDLLPDKAWGQGFMSRVIMIYSDQRLIVDDFAPTARPKLEELQWDLIAISNLYGQFTVTPAYAKLVHEWMHDGQPIAPTHPRLIHYCSRRKVNLYKLSMITSVNRDNSLIIDTVDFNEALRWLAEAESVMPMIFKAGAGNADATAMDEVLHYIKTNDFGKGVSSSHIIHFAQKLVPLNTINRVIEVLHSSQQIDVIGQTRDGMKFYKFNPKMSDL